MVVISGFVMFILILLIFILLYVLYRLGQAQQDRAWQAKLQKLRGEIADKQRAVVKGGVAETFAPLLGDFPFKPSECKFLGDPIDYVVFEGLNERNITAIHFVDVKADSSQLKKHQKQIKEIVEQKGPMSFLTYRIKTEDI